MDYSEVWVIDTEYYAPHGEIPLPLCICGIELKSGKRVSEWLEGRAIPCPLPSDNKTLLVCFQAESEWSCYIPLGWPEPTHILDLAAEFKNRTNTSSGREVEKGMKVKKNLLFACQYFGIPCMSAAAKDMNRDRCQQGPPFTEEERSDILKYCGDDVDLTAELYRAMLDKIDLPRALLRGRYTWSVAAMENQGVPLDVESLTLLGKYWSPLQERLIEAINPAYGVYEGRVFKIAAFTRYLEAKEIAWPKTPTGKPKTDDETFKAMAAIYPDLLPLKELRATLSALKLRGLAVGRDGVNRAKLWPFGGKSARNAPSSTAYIFGPAVWLRSLIKPRPGMALAYVDYAKEEWGIAAFFSKDEKMQAAYLAEDPYIEFGIQAGVVPKGATKQSHGRQRDLLKSCVLGISYGMGAQRLAMRIEAPTAFARELLQYHKLTYCKYWDWSQCQADKASLFGYLQTCFGWTLHIRHGVTNKNERSVRNFMLQAHGSEILRVASILLNEAGIAVCAPVHDAFLIQAPAGKIDEVAKKTQAIMEEASRVVLNGFSLKTDVTVIRDGDRYSDPRGRAMWELVMEILHQLESENLPTGGVASD